jgi:Ser/Thr protein kinase RdoA (MazF antagonist)
MTHPYSALTPEAVLDAAASLGLRPDGRLLSLNSYENRVYQVWLDDGEPVVLKFYRPGRWTRAQIEEEHAFAHELAEREVPMVAPTSLAEFTGFLFAAYPRRGGRSPNLEDPKVLEWIGRFIGRIMPSAPCGRSGSARASTRRRSAPSRASGCSRTRRSRQTSSRPGRPSASRRWPR